MTALEEFLKTSISTQAKTQEKHLIPILTSKATLSSTGYAYLPVGAYRQLRDSVPQLFCRGRQSLHDLSYFTAKVHAAKGNELSPNDIRLFDLAAQVVRSVINTAAITAPSDLWLLRHILGYFYELGLTQQLLQTDGAPLQTLELSINNRRFRPIPEELEIDLRFLVSRGYLEDQGGHYRLSAHPTAQNVFSRIQSLPKTIHTRTSQLWRSALSGESLRNTEQETLLSLLKELPSFEQEKNHGWVADPSEIEMGYLYLPLALGIHSSGLGAKILSAEALQPELLHHLPEMLQRGVQQCLVKAGVIEPGYHKPNTLSPLGKRMLTRGPSPHGIIEAYFPYLQVLPSILVEGKGSVHVAREGNIAASQTANRRSFEQANDALDQFTKDTGFRYDVFIEHALGRGEATRQRFEREKTEKKPSRLNYIGADLEDTAIDAAMDERDKGNLPNSMVFVRDADIGQPAAVLNALTQISSSYQNAVMIVGNGFHEIQSRTDEAIKSVFREYHDAGMVLIFTEENALLDDDLLQTAWNTYHAGFRYCHERSGQLLRPAQEAPVPKHGKPLLSSWSSCLSQVGYVRLPKYCSRSRTIFPYRPKNGRNPAISVTHFFIPAPLACQLGL